MHRSYETQYTFWTYTVAAHCYAAAHYYVVCVFDQRQHMWQEFVCSCVCVCVISRDSGWSCLTSEWLWWNLLETLFLSLLHTCAHSLVYCVLLGCLAIQRWEKIEILWFSSASRLHPSFPPSVFSFLSSCQSSKQAVLSNDHNCRSSLQNGRYRNEQTQFAPSNRCDVNS